MNNLNSIIIEGKVIDTNVKIVLTGKTFIFTIEVLHTYRNANGETVDDKSKFDVVYPYNENTKVCVEKITEGRSVRVVGRLHLTNWTDTSGKKNSKVDVFAEHIEIK